MDKYVAIIPVRGGSKSIPLKNIQPMNGRPLVYWTLDAAVNCAEIDRVYLCTDSEAIRSCCHAYIKQYHCGDKLICIDRPAETATDTASTESVMVHFAETYPDFTHIILIQATSPLLTTANLSGAIQTYERDNCDSMLSVVRQKRFHWGEGENGYVPTNYDFHNRPRRQEFDGYLVENGAFYINSRENFISDHCRLSGKIGVYEMDEESFFEIDEPSDWIIIEHLLKRKMPETQVDFVEKAQKIKMLITDCDGVLTDGGMYYSEHGDELKKFTTRDGMGVQLLREQGIRFGIITGEKSDLVQRRSNKLKADVCYVGISDKVQILNEICTNYGLSYDEIAYIGDDINDIGVLSKVGLACSVPNGTKCVKEIAHLITKNPGGSGAVREVIDFIIAQQTYKNK